MENKKQILKQSLLALIVLFFFSCKNAEHLEEATESPQVMQDTTGVATPADSTQAIAADTTAVPFPPSDSTAVAHHPEDSKDGTVPEHTKNNNEPDRSPASEPSEPTTSPEGSVVVYCPEKMIEATPNIISVTISKAELKKAIEKVKNEVAKIQASQIKHSQNDVQGQTIPLAEKMKVSLISNDEDFKILDKPVSEEQIFGAQTELKWYWTVVPKEIKKMQMQIKIYSFDEKQQKWIDNNFPIVTETTVTIDPRGYIAKLWTYFQAHPEWLLSQIIFPVVGYYAGQRKKRTV
ncbi:MAG: hypothetical protein JST78_09370 [Bacteroidetes bacterium]|nr:hypothetical protein [Bacteroidota bacterium]